MIALGLKLTEQGKGDYWDDVDRWVRNMFAEGQLTPAKADYLTGKRYSTKNVPFIVQEQADGDQVVERWVGGFLSQPLANDGNGSLPIPCCTGNGTRAIYYVWQNILTWDAGKLKVNLLLNRASPWADVDSHIPYQGQVDVRIKKAVNLSIRIPEWVKPEKVRVQVNGNDRRLQWEGRYAVVGAVVAGDVAVMKFPISERTDTVWIEKHKYTLTRKGNDVIAIDPPGRVCPLVTVHGLFPWIKSVASTISRAGAVASNTKYRGRRVPGFESTTISSV
jgi:hypothetical protein